MPGTLRLVAPGARALSALRDAIVAAKRDDPFAAVTVVAPSAATRLRLRHELAALEEPTPLLNVRVVLLRELADELAREMVGRRARATRLVVRTLCARELERSGGFLAPIARHRSSADELALVYETVGFARPDALEVLSSYGGRRAELAAVLAAVRARLSGSFVDDVDVFEAATRSASSARLSAFGAVLVHAPIRVRPVEARFVGRLAELGEVEVLLLETGGADPVAERMAARLEGVGLERRGQEEVTSIEYELEEHLDPRAEVHRAFTVIVEELERGARPEELALCVAATEPYLQLVERRAAELQLTLAGPTHRRLTDAPLARLLLGFFELVRLGVSRGRFVDWLASAPLDGPLGRSLDRAATDRVTRIAGIGDGDLASWRPRLETALIEARRRGGAPDPSAPASERHRAALVARTARETAVLLEALGGLEAMFTEARALTSFEEGVALSRTLVRELCGDTVGSDGDGVSPDTLVLEVLDQLAVLERTGARSGLESFGAALEVALDRPGPPIGTPGRGILVGRLEATTGLSLRLVVVVGATEGNVPQAERTGALLDASTEELLEVDEASPVERLQRERYRLLSCLGAGARSLVTVPRLELSTARLLLRSRFVHEPSLERAGTGAALSRAEFEAELLRKHRRSEAPVGAHFLVLAAPDLQRLERVQTSRLSQSFDAYAGRIDAAGLLEGLSGAGYSPTTLEEYASCPLRYFFDRELAIEVLDPPESLLSIAPRERGTLAHAVLERLVGTLLRDGELDDGEERELLRRLIDEEGAALEARGLTGKEVTWTHERRRLTRVLDAERRRDRQRRAGGRRPLAVEHRFGMGTVAPVEVALGDERLSFRGSIDRVDELANGSLAVVDYKTGRSNPYEGLVDDPVDRGRHLQLAIYALAAAMLASNEAPGSVASAAYRLLDDEGREFEVPADEATRARLEAVLETVTGSIRAGLFPAHPGPDGWLGPPNCRWCDFSAACRSDRVAHFEAIATRPELSAYVGLVADGDESA